MRAEEEKSWIKKRGGSLPAYDGNGLMREGSLPVFPYNQARLGGERNKHDELVKRHTGIQQWFNNAKQTTLVGEGHAGEHRSSESPRNTFKAISQTGELAV